MSASADPDDIRNWDRRPDGITTSGKLEAKDPARLASIGIKHVINLGTNDHPETLIDEAELLAEHGIAYTHIPVPFDAPLRDHIDEMRSALSTNPGPCHVHCIMNYRVTAFFYVLDLESGVSQEMAHAQMAKTWNPLASDDPRAAPWRELLS
ncbi:MAG: sulfur transferase domain-containing protein [Pseudomonadota bacterium]